MNGYAGKILKLNLADRAASVIETAAYQRWVGGHGLGSAIFWDLCKDKTIDGFDERNVMTIMTSPLTGTLAPGGASRVEVQAIGVQAHPYGWFTRSNLGGRFGAMLKAAGWDGIVIEGAAGSPVWVDIRNGDVKIRDAKELWGLDAWETQKRIWREVGNGSGEWTNLGDPFTDGRTTQKPAVIAIGRAGEKRGRIACLIHDAGNAAGQGGFGGIWGAKNLKAISVIGTGGVHVADPKALFQARAWAVKNFRPDIDDPEHAKKGRDLHTFCTQPVPINSWKRQKRSRPQACVGCPAGCKPRNESGRGNESTCADETWYTKLDVKCDLTRALLNGLTSLAGPLSADLAIGKSPDIYQAVDLAQRHGINCFELFMGVPYLINLHKMGALGPGRDIDCDLPFKKLGEYEFAEKLLNMIADREGVGDDMAEGFVRAAKRWGRLEEDLASGVLNYPHWGLPSHYDPRYQIEWGFGTMMGDRDINEHSINQIMMVATFSLLFGGKPEIEAEEFVKIFSEKMQPYSGDPLMLDFGEENRYSERMAKLVAWHRHSTRVWLQSALYCEMLFPDLQNVYREDKRGMSPEAETKFLNAVTGEDLSYLDYMERGRRIWNLDNAIWTMQGRHRDMAKFAPFVYDQPQPAPVSVQAVENGKWKYVSARGWTIDREKFEQWKTRYYKLEGWDPETGWPRRRTLEDLDMKNVADELEQKGRLGKD